MNRIYLWHERISKKDYTYKLCTTNTFNIPHLNNIAINIGINDSINESKKILSCITALELVTNQKPIIYRSKKSISIFKLRKNTVIGCKLILRKQNLYNFLDIFIFFALPKLNNFKGFTNITTNLHNNINIGIFDFAVFPQLNDHITQFPKNLGGTFTFKIEPTIKYSNLILNSFQVPNKKIKHLLK